MQYKRGLQRLRSGIIGDGLLVRARAMSLALLGATAAVGLAIVALALNQGWPLVPGSGIPSLPPRHQAVGAAAVAARPHPARTSGPHASGRQRRAASSAPRKPPAAGGESGQAATPAPPAELVVTPATPAPTHGSGGKPKGGSSPKGSAPKPQAPGPAPAQATPPSTPSPATQPAPAAETPPPADPPATVSDAPPEESNVPSWSNGKGHAYGRAGHDD